MSPSSSIRRLVCALVALGAFALPAVARAESITIPNPLPTRSFPPPFSAYQSTWINYADCVNNLKLSFTYNVDAATIANSGDTIEIWAGTSGNDCSQLGSRNAPNTATQLCWPVGLPPYGKGANGSATVSLAARDIIAQFSTSPKTLYQGPYSSAICDFWTSMGQATITLWFIVKGPDGSGLANAQQTITADLLGPSPPTNVTAGVGDTALIVNFTPSGDTTATLGYNVYCDPPPVGKVAPDASSDASATTTDAGQMCLDGGFTDGGFNDAGDAMPGTPIDGGCFSVANPTGADGSSSVASNCQSKVLVSGGGTQSTNEAGQVTIVGGKQTAIDPAYLCGSVGSPSSTSVTAGPLANGTYYTIAVAAYDSFGNIGSLGTPACSTPMPITDFWAQYRADGGQAGGGFCSLGPPTPASTVPLVLVAGWGIIAVVRRRKKT